MSRWKCFQKSIGDSCGAFCCFNIFLSRASGSKWWQKNSIRSLNYLNECMKFVGSLRHHRSRDLWSVYASSLLTYNSLKSSSFPKNARKSSKCLGQATSPSASYVSSDKWSKNSFVTSKEWVFDIRHGGLNTKTSMIYFWRFKIGMWGLNLSSIPPSSTRNVDRFDPPTCQDISQIRSPN